MPEAPWTRRRLLHTALSALDAASIPDARRNAEWILSDVLGGSRTLLLAYPEAPVSPEAAARALALVARRCRREPLQYVLGHTDFFGLRLAVSPAVLIPRPETEQVVEAALARLTHTPAPRLLDVGTGSGCIPVALRHQRPDATVWACDLSPEALALARTNAAAHHLSITFFEADALAPTFSSQAPSNLDLLISNPPYVPDPEAGTLAPEVRDHEPHLALFSGPDPLVFYRALAHHAAVLLRPSGHLVFETHADHAEAVAALLAPAGFTHITVQRDLAGHPRIVAAQRP